MKIEARVTVVSVTPFADLKLHDGGERYVTARSHEHRGGLDTLLVQLCLDEAQAARIGIGSVLRLTLEDGEL